MAFALGKIVKSNSHLDYVCQVYGEGEVAARPQPEDYALGTFVRIHPDAGDNRPHLIGVVYNTMLLNPDFGTLGPRLSQRADLEVFSPDYLSETATLLGIVAVGWQETTGAWHQGAPTLAATINGEVMRLSEAEVVAFHSDAAGRPALHYAPMLLSLQSPVVLPLLLGTVDRLSPHFPQNQAALAVLRNNLAWRRVVEPAR